MLLRLLFLSLDLLPPPPQPPLSLVKQLIDVTFASELTRNREELDEVIPPRLDDSYLYEEDVPITRLEETPIDSSRLSLISMREVIGRSMLDYGSCLCYDVGGTKKPFSSL